MAKKNEEKVALTKTEWVQRFNLIGEAKVNDFTYRIDTKSEKSDWVYNSINLGVFCGEKAGTVFCELMGGYGSERDNVVYVFGKKDDGTADYANSYTIDWDDRFDEDILADLPDALFTTVGLEKTDKDKTYYKKFLTPYDTIAYIHENLKDGMVINVSGNLRYTVYNGTIQCRKEINSIALSTATPDKYHATFTQTMLLDKNSCTKDSLNKDKSVLVVDAYILEKFREFNGWDLTDNGKNKGGQFVPLKKSFEFEVDLTTDIGKKKVQAVLTSDKMFKVKKGVAQITFEGKFVETGATVQATLDDIPDDIKELIEMGVYSEEEALAKCSENGSRERRMIITKPVIRMVGEEGEKQAVIQRTDEKFAEEDLIMDCLSPKETEEEEEADVEVDDIVDSDESAGTSDDDWLNAL